MIFATIAPDLAETILVFSPKYTEGSELNDAGWDMVRALCGIFGGVMIGWGITITHLAENFTAKTQKWLTIAAVGWFVTDSTASLMNNLEYNVILNVSILAALLIVNYLPNLQGSPPPSE